MPALAKKPATKPTAVPIAAVVTAKLQPPQPSKAAAELLAAAAKPATVKLPKVATVEKQQKMYPLLHVRYHMSGLEERKDIPKAWIAPPIGEAEAKKLLGWETQSEYTARVVKDPAFIARVTEALGGEEPTLQQLKDASAFSSDEGIFVLLTDANGEEVTCWNNRRNREFRPNDCKKLIQATLNREWAGPITIPGHTINGETIVISWYGDVESGQHRLLGVVLANQILAGATGWKNWTSRSGEFWAAKWPDHQCCLETLITYGISDDPRVLMTLDNVVPRSGADVVSTSQIFKEERPADRVKLSQMIDNAVKFLWKRTGADGDVESGISYLSPPQVLSFIDRHPKLITCIRHMAGENKNNAISLLRLSAGECAAMLYLMGSSSSDVDDYTNASPRTERELLWEKWDTAIDFWRKVVKEQKNKDAAVTAALRELIEDEEGRKTEKHAIIAKAWKLFADGNKEFTKEEVKLVRNSPCLPEDDYVIDSQNQYHLKAGFEFGGIDLGHKAPKPQTETPVTEEEKEAALTAEREKKAAELAAKAEKAKAAKNGKAGKGEPAKGMKGPPTVIDKRTAKLNLLRKDAPGCVLLCSTAQGQQWTAYGDDAVLISTLSNDKIAWRDDNGLQRADFAGSKKDEVLGWLLAKGRQVAFIEQKEGKETIRKVGTPPSKPTVTKPATAPKK